MSGIIFGSGTFIRIGDPIPELTAEDIVCDDAADKAIKALGNMAKAAAEASFTISMSLGKRPLWRLIYGRPQRWPVSNNWLKMHGYPMRRRGC